MSKEPLLQVRHLRVQIQADVGTIQPVDQVSLSINEGELFAVVGESGCGKTLTALAISRLLPENAYLCEGSEVMLEGIPLHQLSENQISQQRGAKIGMVFQDPAMALNPIMTIGEQIKEAIGAHQKLSNKKMNEKMLDLLKKVQLPQTESMFRKYPHQLSGGMKQRVVIAMALAQSPRLLIADEPTTALDVTTQAQILLLLKELNRTEKMAILLITHDLGIVAQMADKVAVMYAGHIVEQASKTEFMRAPKHPYSQQLFAALPEQSNPHRMLAAIPGTVPLLNKNFHLCRFKDRCAFIFNACEAVAPKLVPVSETNAVRCHWYDPDITKHLPQSLKIQSLSSIILKRELNTDRHLAEKEDSPLIKVTDLKVHFPIHAGILKRTVGYVKAVDGVSFEIAKGQTLALVGESGSGKTTVGKAILRLIAATQGTVTYDGENIFALNRREMRRKHGSMQMIFQDPYSSMDPRMQISEILKEGMLALKIGSDEAERKSRIEVLLDQVGLPRHMKDRYPHELSGGQRQRIAIARALAVGAQFIVCDEPTSALDVSVQAQILNLLKDLQNELEISYLFITHNIGVINYLADQVAVMHAGRIVEYGAVETVLKNPKDPYTQTLLRAVPSIRGERIHDS